jgi:Secretion system C-terminal sorting domain/Pectate lyase superfamily protein
MRLSILKHLFLLLSAATLFAQRGYYDAPYLRYEADLGTLSNGATATPKSYAQVDLQSEASGQKCVSMASTNASVQWNLTASADGLVVRYSIPDGQTASLAVYNEDTLVTTLSLTTNWSWESLWNNGNPNNGGVVNQNPKMRFDEVRYKLPTPIAAGGTLKLVRVNGNINLDFVELEAVPAAIAAPIGSAVYSGNGSTLQSFINSHGGQVIYVPEGVYNVNSELYFGVANTSLVGAGMWYTQLNFTSTTAYNGGLRANANNISYSDLYLTTNRNSRSNSYKGINGVYTSGSTIRNIWAEHFECGAWIAQYATGGPAFADGFTLSNCRFRNNYADGINLCKGTSNAIVEHCNFRNNGDDDQAIWCADGLECINNTFRYNTSENCWRASGLAFYGGKNNKAYNLIIRDNIESGIRLSNNFPGVGFNSLGLNELHDITIIGAGTLNDLYNQRVGAIDIFSSSTAGTQVKNVKFSNIDLIDSKCDGILMQKKAGDGLYNFAFENININGTGKEYPFNNAYNTASPKGFFTAISNFPNGNATFCNLTYANRGGDATTDEYLLGLGAFSWTALAGCVPLAITKPEAAVVSFYPNPVQDKLTIANLRTTTTISIHDLSGKMLLQQVFHQGVAILDVSGLSCGLYAVTLDDGEQVRTNKFVKQ